MASESQRKAWRRWAASNPDKVQANKNAWAKSDAGKAWLKANQAKKNQRRDEWRAKKKTQKDETLSEPANKD